MMFKTLATTEDGLKNIHLLRGRMEFFRTGEKAGIRFCLIKVHILEPILSSGATPKTVTPIWSLGHIVRIVSHSRF